MLCFPTLPPPQQPRLRMLAGRKRQRTGELVHSAAGAIVSPAAALAAAAEQTALQLLLQHLAQQNSAARPGMPKLGAQLNNNSVIRAAMAAMAAGELTPLQSPMSAAGAHIWQTYAGGQASLSHASTGLQVQLPDRWQSHVRALVPRLSTTGTEGRKARNARLAEAGAGLPQLLLEGADAHRSGANCTELALVTLNRNGNGRPHAAGWRSRGSDTDSDDEERDTLILIESPPAPALGDGSLQQLTASTSALATVGAPADGSSAIVAAGDGSLQQLTAVKTSTAVVAVDAAANSSSITVQADARLTSLTGALVPADSLQLQPPPVSLLTWNIWGAVCVSQSFVKQDLHDVIL